MFKRCSDGHVRIFLFCRPNGQSRRESGRWDEIHHDLIEVENDHFGWKRFNLATFWTKKGSWTFFYKKNPWDAFFGDSMAILWLGYLCLNFYGWRSFRRNKKFLVFEASSNGAQGKLQAPKFQLAMRSDKNGCSIPAFLSCLEDHPGSW